jgi:hypothetical protein
MNRFDDLSRQIAQALSNRVALRHQENVLSRFWYEAEAYSIGQICYQVEELATGPQLKNFMQAVHLNEQQWRTYKYAFLQDYLSRRTEPHV